jgi:hypothetical protein
MRGKCPVCGVANCACGGPSKVIAVDKSTYSGGGTLSAYPLGRGVSILLTDEHARALGYKKQEPVQNKKRIPTRNKGVKP